MGDGVASDATLGNGAGSGGMNMSWAENGGGCGGVGGRLAL